jgi:hypothetical protein
LERSCFKQVSAAVLCMMSWAAYKGVAAHRTASSVRQRLCPPTSC